jgi:glycine/D-amino acid oxidase-like deaminating enzyme
MAALMARTRYGSSPWLDAATSRKPTYPRPAGTLELPIAIVGGGLTGSLTAYACAAAGLRVALLEADLIGRDATALSAGAALPDPGTRYRDDEQRHGRRASRAAWQSMRRACLDLQAAVRRLNIRCAIAPADAVVFARSQEAARALRRELDARRGAGLEGTWATPRSLAAFGIEAAGGLAARGAARLDPLRAAAGFARAAAVRGAAVFERAPVSKIEVSRHGVGVTVGRALLRVEQIVIATGDPIDAHHALRRHVPAAERYAVETGPLPAPLRKLSSNHDAILTEWADTPHRLQWRDDRILWTGTDQPRTPERSIGAAIVRHSGQLMYELSLVMPEISGTPPAYGWRMPYGRTADGWPLVGQHRNFPRHLFAFGLGDSLTASYLASRILARHLAGSPDNADEIFGFARVAAR